MDHEREVSPEWVAELREVIAERLTGLAGSE
jgi:hypothetical protein